MRRFLITLVTLALIITFGALKSTWAGFSYFALVLSCLLCVYWVVLLAIDYYNRFIKLDEERYKLYVASLVNYKNLNLSDIEQNQKFYIKKFKKSMWKEKLVEIGKIIFLIGVIVGCIVVLFNIS